MILPKKKTVAGILGSFYKMIDHLEAIALRELNHRSAKGEHVNGLLKQIEEHDAEADRARKAAAKIKALIDG